MTAEEYARLPDNGQPTELVRGRIVTLNPPIQYHGYVCGNVLAIVRQYVKEHFARLTPEERREVLRSLPAEEQREVLQALPPEKQQEVLQALPPERRLAGLPPEVRLAGLSAEQIRQYLDQLTAGRPAQPRKPRRKK